VEKAETVTLWCPVGPKELALIEASEMLACAPRLPEQPIFCPVLTEDYAVKIARDWNVPAGGAGFVTRFHGRTSSTATRFRWPAVARTANAGLRRRSSKTSTPPS
jgi:hypothetical protein